VDSLSETHKHLGAHGAVVSCGAGPASAETTRTLRSLNPWRKGPFLVDGTHVDSEWRSDIKWLRLCRYTGSLAGQTVLDVGSGNGYYMLRALGAGANAALGLEPGALAAYQFSALRKRAGPVAAAMLPLRFGDFPTGSELFDSVLHMGVLYHTRSPLAHLAKLRRISRPGARIVLETLVVDGGADDVLVPPGRYARMRNVWMLPSCLALERWLARSGFRHFDLVSVSRTRLHEQRTTEWMPFESLDRALDSADEQLTVEGLQAPTRAMWVIEA
jgi:tRNA (mo5U34)-methyltransferase